MLEEGVFAAMMADDSLQANVAGRITPIIPDKDSTFPAISFFTVVGTNDVALDSTAIVKTDIQVDFWAKTYLETKTGQRLLHDLFDGYQGTLPDGTLVNEVTSHTNPDFYEKDTLIYRSSTTFSFTH